MKLDDGRWIVSVETDMWNTLALYDDTVRNYSGNVIEINSETHSSEIAFGVK
jgi:hypothetical protein